MNDDTGAPPGYTITCRTGPSFRSFAWLWSAATGPASGVALSRAGFGEVAEAVSDAWAHHIDAIRVANAPDGIARIEGRRLRSPIGGEGERSPRGVSRGNGAGRKTPELPKRIARRGFPAAGDA